MELTVCRETGFDKGERRKEEQYSLQSWVKKPIGVDVVPQFGLEAGV